MAYTLSTLLALVELRSWRTKRASTPLRLISDQNSSHLASFSDLLIRAKHVFHWLQAHKVWKMIAYHIFRNQMGSSRVGSNPTRSGVILRVNSYRQLTNFSEK